MQAPAPPFFVNREREVQELRRLADRHVPTLILLYGRRRVGKTYLLGYAWQDRRVFYFLAAATTDQLNRQELLRELAAWSGNAIDPADYPTWRTIFRLFVLLAERSPLIVVLDEFQYLLGHPDDVPSQLVAVWDREARGRPLTLALCGSATSTMERLQTGGQPLFGRPTWTARVRPFDYRDAARMLPDRKPREAAILYGVFGGTARYLAAIDPSASIAETVVQTMLSPRGEVHLQLQTLIEQEQGIRDASDYRAVLAAIASGKTDVNQITQAAGLGERTYIARRALGVLEDLELVWRERNFGASEKAPYQYRIADNAVRFWYRFVHPSRSRLETGNPEEVWESAIEPYLNDYMGTVFPQLCRQAYVRYHQRWGLAGAAEWARWEGRDRKRRDIELDIVARLDDGRVLTGEIKWSLRPVGYELHAHLLRNLQDLSRSGQGWAKEALAPETSAGHLYFSAGGFDEELRAAAQRERGIHLLTLDDLYPAV